MEQTTHEFFHDFRQELMADAEANSAFQLEAFMNNMTNELTETGFVDGFEFCSYRAQRGMRVDGYYWNQEEETLDLFIADFECRNELASLTRTDVTSIYKRATNFFEASRKKRLYCDLEETAPEYGLARMISDLGEKIRKVEFYLLSERILSERLQSLEDNFIADTEASYHIWDISRLQRQRSSHGQKEQIEIDFTDMYGMGISCLPAHLGPESYPSYLIVMPGEILANLYGRYGARLLEQNVRSFLQTRSKVNKGIRSTILNEPNLFFAYNNGITATAQEVETKNEDSGMQITRIKDLQIVNGGQTTASLFHTRRKDKASLEYIFVQMKLSVVDSEASEEVVPKISEYANTQNRVNAADFFANHPFHIQFEKFSRRIWVPAQQGSLRETKWFYERARGQYADAQAKLTPADQRRFIAEYPKAQMFTKTDLAKFDNVWDDHPKWVNLGAQKNFAKYAFRIGNEWSKSPLQFNEYYFKRAIARAIVFRHTEKLVSSQSWYNGGYRANIVAYAISLINECSKRKKKHIDFISIWDNQSIPQYLSDALAISAKYVHEDISQPPAGISNISEWCKKDACWDRLLSGIEEIEQEMPGSFWYEMISSTEHYEEANSAKKDMKVEIGITAQSEVCNIHPEIWAMLLREGTARKFLTDMDVEALRVAEKLPNKIPTEKQSFVLLEVIEKARLEGIKIE